MKTRSSQTTRVFLLGASLQGGNRGVQALCESMISLMHEVRPNSKITLWASEREIECPELEVHGVPVRVFGYRLSPTSKAADNLLWQCVLAFIIRWLPFQTLRESLLARAPILLAIANSDVVGSIWGGDSFSDIYGQVRYWKRMLPHIPVLLLGGRLVLTPQTFGPFESRIAALGARFLFGRASVVFARDSRSLDFAREMLGASGSRVEPQLSPDVAFALPVRIPDPLPIEPPLPDDKSALLVGLNLSGLLAIGGYTGRNMFGLRAPYTESMLNLVSELLKDPGTRILIVPHVFGDTDESDEVITQRFVKWTGKRYPGRVHYVSGTPQAAELKWMIGLCDVFIGARMHACIAALSQGVPAIGIAYSRKFEGVFATAGVADWVVDPRRLDREELVRACLERIALREETRALLAPRAIELRNRLRVQTERMLEVTE